MLKKRLFITILTAAVLMTGCSLNKETKKYDDNTVVAAAGDIEIDYATASTYARLMQAETYSYLQQYASSADIDVWSETLMDEKPQYETYGEQFDAGVIDAVKELLLTKLHMEEYNAVFTDEDRKNCEEVVKVFLVNTPEEAITAMRASEESMMHILELVTINSKVKSEIVSLTTPEVSDEDARQVGFQYILISKESNDDPDAIASKILDDISKDVSLEDAAEELGQSVQSATFTANDPEYDDFPGGIVEHVEQIKVNQCDSFSDDYENTFIVCRTSDNEKNATDIKKKNLISKKMDDAYKDKIAEWEQSDKIILNEEAWVTLSASADEIFKAIETYE